MSMYWILALSFVYLVALMVYTLMERQIRKKLKEDKKMGLMSQEIYYYLIQLNFFGRSNYFLDFHLILSNYLFPKEIKKSMNFFYCQNYFGLISFSSAG
jgi:hypothetical protein